MQDQERHPSVQFGGDIAFQERTWMAQRTGWWAMGLLLLAGLAGVFATGPLSSVINTDSTGALQVEYERFQRHMAPSTLRLRIASEAVSGGTVAVRLNSDFLNALKVEEIVPEPDQTKVTPSGVEYTISAAEPGNPVSVRFFLSAEGFGPVQAEVGLIGREPARFTVFIYP